MSSNDSIVARTQRLNKQIVSSSEGTRSDKSLTRDTLLDAFDALYNECNKDALKKSDRNILEFSKKYQNVVAATKKLRVSASDFNIKSLIGKGYFGEVYLVSENITNDVYALKKVPKQSFEQSKEERNILAISRSEWIPKLQYAFQDNSHLYLVMEYLPGGDLYSLMVRNNTFPEDVIRFYLAEISQALNALHSLGFVHRDIKPENILLDRFGHLKLTDFGSAIAIRKDGHITSFTPAGTPNYIAPELLQPLHHKRPTKTIYNETCDYWSMGIIAYEMLTETTPFHSNTVSETYDQILSYIDSVSAGKLKYPPETMVSTELRDLIDHLVTPAQNRLTYKKIVTHRFFYSVDWMKLRKVAPPIIPILRGDDDTSNFEEDLKKSKRNNTYDASSPCSNKAASFSGLDLPFIGYGYVHDDGFNDFATSSESKSTEVGRLTTHVKTLQKTIDTQMTDINSLQQSLSEYQKKCSQVTSIEKILAVTKEEMHTLKDRLKEKTTEIASCRTEIKTLKNSLKIEEEQRAKNDANIADVLNSTYQKWERAKKLSEQNYEKKISDKNSEVMILQEKLNLCEKKLESKTGDCAHLQETIDNFKERLKSSKSQNDTEKTAFARKHRDSNVHFEGQLRELRSKLQKQVDAKHVADDEIQKLKTMNEETNRKISLLSDQRKKLDKVTFELTQQLNKEMAENRSLQSDKHKLAEQITDLQQKLEGLSVDNYKVKRASTNQADSIEGSASVYCSLESITSEIENQLKKDLVMAKEGEHEQRLRANNLEETVRRLETVIERVSQQRLNGVDTLLERKNEKLEEKLCTVQERATVERQASRSAHLQLWKLEKELDTVKALKEQTEQTLNKLRNEKDELQQKVKENRISSRHREERITELQNDLASLKKEVQFERSKWESVDKERNKDKSQIINQNTKIHKLEIDLDECRSKMRLFEQLKNDLQAENKQLTLNLRKEDAEHDHLTTKLTESQQNYETLLKNHEMLKSVCSLMETQLNELVEMYNSELEKNKEKSSTVDGLWEEIRDRDAKLLKFQQDLRDERSQAASNMQKSTDASNELLKLKEALSENEENMHCLYQELAQKTASLIKSEELIEVQKEEIQSLLNVNQSYEREMVIIKEENSKLLTELFISKESYQKLNNEHTLLYENYADLKKELEELNSTVDELNKYHKQRDIKAEATLAQYKKLIDYLQKRVDEYTQKKKKTFAEFIFGSSNGNSTSKKENIPPTPTNNTTKKEFQSEKKVPKTKSVGSFKKSAISVSKPAQEAKRETTVVNYPSSATSVRSDTHQFERISHLNSSNSMEECNVCKKNFKNDTAYHCKKCSVYVHQYCRGSNMKCNASNASSADSEASSLDAEPLEDAWNAVLKLKTAGEDQPLEVLCMHEILENVLLLGCSTGLKAYNINDKKMLHIANIDNIVGMSVVPMFSKSLLISENGQALLQCETQHLQMRANASVCLNTGLDCVELNTQGIKDNGLSNEMWRMIKIFDNTDRDLDVSEPIAIAATNSQIVIFRYDVQGSRFTPIRSLDTASPVQSIHFTPFTAIVSSDKFFEIDLNSFVSEEFLDLSDHSLLQTLTSEPLNSFAISDEEFLLCFKDFGIFVNEFGCRSRQTQLKWLTESPKAFAYVAPILYIIGDRGIQMLHTQNIVSDTPEIDDQKFINMEQTTAVTADSSQGIYLLSAEPSTTHHNHQQVVRINGTKALGGIKFPIE